MPLHGIIGLAVRTEHPVGNRAQLAALRLETFRQPGTLVHRSPFLAAPRQLHDAGNLMTNARQPK
jgi:hypothetical protein